MEMMLKRDPITGIYEMVPAPEQVELEVVANVEEVVVQSPKKVGRPRGVKNATDGSGAASRRNEPHRGNSDR